jgi:hypothetical protein
MTDRKMSSIPRWAQDMIAQLQEAGGRKDRLIAQLTGQLTDNPDGSNVFAEPYSDTPRPLGRDTMIRFGNIDTEEGSWNVEVRDGELVIVFQSLLGRQGVGVIPLSSNSVKLRSVEL